jgi:hypothetical protein
LSQFQAHVPDVPLGAVAKIANARTARVKDAKNEGIFPLKWCIENFRNKSSVIMEYDRNLYYFIINIL